MVSFLKRNFSHLLSDCQLKKYKKAELNRNSGSLWIKVLQQPFSEWLKHDEITKLDDFLLQRRLRHTRVGPDLELFTRNKWAEIEYFSGLVDSKNSSQSKGTNLMKNAEPRTRIQNQATNRFPPAVARDSHVQQNKMFVILQLDGSPRVDEFKIESFSVVYNI